MSQPYILMQAAGTEPTEEWLKLGLEAQLANKFPEAEKYYRSALRLDPRNTSATQNLAILFAQTGNINEALLTIERAAIFNSNEPIIWTNKAFMNLEADRIDDALAAAKFAVSIAKSSATDLKDKQGYLNANLSLAMISAAAGTPENALPLYNDMLKLESTHPSAALNACFVQTLMDCTPKELLEQRLKWYQANKYNGEKKPHNNDRTLNRALRVGYVGGDFKTHSAAMIFGSIIVSHDKTKITPYVYCTLPVDSNADVYSSKFKTAVGNNWRDISTLDDEKVDALIRNDQIDILVDLAAHTNGGRLSLFTRKPAPIQITGWGFAHGTGVSEIDYFFADKVAIPEEERTHYVEKIFDLPCIVTYRPPLEYGLNGTSVLPFYKNNYITFGSYARYEKLSDKCLETFKQIMLKVPDSRLQFKDHSFRRPYAIRRVLKALDGIAPERVLFSISTSHPEHMSAYQQADIGLDPFPHGGGVVALEQLFMGVPMITLYGSQPSGRTASSVLTCMGKTDWIAKNETEYIDLAVRMTEDPFKLQKIRKTLRDEFLNSSVIIGYREAVESAYQNMWARWIK